MTDPVYVAERLAIATNQLREARDHLDTVTRMGRAPDVIAKARGFVAEWEAEIAYWKVEAPAPMTRTEKAQRAHDRRKPVVARAQAETIRRAQVAERHGDLALAWKLLTWAERFRPWMSGAQRTVLATAQSTISVRWFETEQMGKPRVNPGWLVAA